MTRTYRKDKHEIGFNVFSSTSAKKKVIYRENAIHAPPQKKFREIQKKILGRKIYSERKQKGGLNMLVKDLRLHHELFVFKYFRISPTIFEEPLTWIHHIFRNKEQR